MPFLNCDPDPAITPIMDRRGALIAAAIGAFSVYALVREARAAGPALDRRLAARRWIARQEELARGLHSGVVSEIAWHDEVGRLAREVDVAQLMAEMGRGRMALASEPFMHDPVKRNIRFADEAGQPMRLSYGAATFTFGPDSVITPHAHKHMASAHMVLDGRVRIRTFDRIAEHDGALVIRPSGDVVGAVGDAAAMTTAKDNVHWFKAVTAQAMTFDVIIDGLDRGQDDYLIQPIDPLGGRRQPDGTIIASILSFEDSMQRYPASV